MAQQKDIPKQKEETTAAVKEEQSKNWAEMADDDEDDQEIGVAEENIEKKVEEAAPVEEKKKYEAPAPREKTVRGDYVVTKFVIPDRQAVKKEHKVRVTTKLTHPRID